MPGNHFTKISFYIVAHADDWQLFMCPNVYNDLMASESKVVLIITTAGDAGMDQKYWTAREEGSKSSLKFCLNAFADFSTLEDSKEFNGHLIRYYCAGNAIIYFLRLPDGNLDGSGFESYHFQSLSKLKTEKINSITSIDRSTTYHGWTDLSATLEAILHEESKGIVEKCLNYINPDETIDLNEHADHIATGQAIQYMKSIAAIKQVLFEGYSVSNKKNNLQGTDLFWKVGMFAAYDKAVRDNSNYSTLQEGLIIYLKWCLSSASFIVIEPC